MEKGRMCEQRNTVGLPSKVGVGGHGLTGESVGDGAGAVSAVLVAGQDGVVSAWGEVPVAGTMKENFVEDTGPRATS